MSQENAIAYYSQQRLLVTKCTFATNKKFAILITRAPYNITLSSFVEGNNGAVCVRRRRKEVFTGIETATLLPSGFKGNRIHGNRSWGPSAKDCLHLCAFGSREGIRCPPPPHTSAHKSVLESANPA